MPADTLQTTDFAGSEHRSAWVARDPRRDLAPATSAPAGEAMLHADVCVIGAGVAGLSTAYLLAKAGKRVVVLDAGPAAATGESSRTTAQIATEIDDRYFEIERLHGRRGAALAAESQITAANFIEQTVAAESIACEFERVPGYLFLAATDDPAQLDQEMTAAQRAGVRVEKIPRAPLPAGAPEMRPCLRFPDQAQFDPLKYLDGLAAAVRRMGGQIFLHTRAGNIHGGKPRARVAFEDAREPGRGRGEVHAGAVVVATNTPYNDRVAMHTKQGAYRTYVIAVRVPRGGVERALFWDTLDPYHYGRVMPDDTGDGSTELLLVGGDDHKTGQDDLPAGERYVRLEAWTRQYFPNAGETVYRWSGQVMEPVDGLPYIGRNPLDDDNVFIATGDSGMGMTNGTAAGILLSELIQGRDHAWATLYDPARKTLGSLGEFLHENLNVGKQYLDLVTPGDVKNAEEIGRGEGAVIRHGLSQTAVYRDEAGELRCLSAVCPHLGGIVHWNADEKSWDCPCHGSRFDVHGAVLNGPSPHGLAPKDLP